MHGATIFLKCLYKNNRILGNGGPSKIRIGYFSYMKYFRFIDLNRNVDKTWSTVVADRVIKSFNIINQKS